MEQRDTQQVMECMGLTKGWVIPEFCYLKHGFTTFPEAVLLKDGEVVFGKSQAKCINDEDSVVTSCIESFYIVEPDLDVVIDFMWQRIQPVVSALMVLKGAEHRRVLEWLFRKSPSTLEKDTEYQSLIKLLGTGKDADARLEAFRREMKEGAKDLPATLPVPSIKDGDVYLKVYENGLFDHKAFTIEEMRVGAFRLTEDDKGLVWEAGLYYPKGDEKTIRTWLKDRQATEDGFPVCGNNVRLFASRESIAAYLEKVTSEAIAALRP